MGFPLPPRTNRSMSIEEAPSQPVANVPPPMPQISVPQPSLNETSLLTDDEVGFILRSVLREDQYQDTKVLHFVMSYMQNRNASQAAKSAGLTSAQGYYLRNRPEIHLAIQKLTEKSVLAYGYDAAEVIERVKEIGVFDPVELENPDGSFKTHFSQMAPEARRAIKSFTVKNIYGVDPNGMKIVIGEIIKVDLWDKLKSLELLGREKNIMKETKVLTHDITSNMASVLLESKKRAEARVAVEAKSDDPQPIKDVIELVGKVEDIGV